MLRDSLVLAWKLGQQFCGEAMTVCPLGLGELGVDCALDDRMDERQGPPALDDLRRHEQLGCVGARVLVELGQARGGEEVALLENRKRPGEPVCVVRQASEPEADRPRDRTGADPDDVRGAFGGRSDPLGRETLQKLA